VSAESSMKIMVVDDTRTVLAATKAVLESAHFEVVVRAEPIGTGAAIMRERPALVLLDVEMPLLRGDDIVKLIRRSVWGRGVKVLLHSSLPEEELRGRAEASGADGFVCKTHDPRLLLKSIRKLLFTAEDPSEG